MSNATNGLLFYDLTLYHRNLKKIGTLCFPSSPPPPPHAKACVSRNCDTYAYAKFIFDTAIEPCNVVKSGVQCCQMEALVIKTQSMRKRKVKSCTKVSELL